MKQKRLVLASDSMKFALLGPSPDHLQPVKEVLEKYQLSYQELSDNDLAKEAASYLSNGNIVAVAKGRMEFGPRALGARSILAPATDPYMQERLNTATKYRENFRPFAPIVCEEDAKDYFDIGSNTSPYMLKTYTVKSELRIEHAKIEKDIIEKCKEIRSTIPAVTHIDYSARVQTVCKEQKFLHNILTEYKGITNMAVLVNTSFNVRGEPIVNNSTQAVECYLHTDIDVLIIQNFIIVKKAQSIESLRPKEKLALGVD
jgi:carbamoyltransferase